MGWCWWVVSEDEGGGLVFEVDVNEDFESEVSIGG